MYSIYPSLWGDTIHRQLLNFLNLMFICFLVTDWVADTLSLYDVHVSPHPNHVQFVEHTYAPISIGPQSNSIWNVIFVDQRIFPFKLFHRIHFRSICFTYNVHAIRVKFVFQDVIIVEQGGPMACLGYLLCPKNI